MAKKRPERTERRARERKVRQLVKVTEKLAGVSAGGSAALAIAVDASPQIEIRVHTMRCPQCNGDYKVLDHRSAGQGVRPVDVQCNLCAIKRTLWFKIVEREPN